MEQKHRDIITKNMTALVEETKLDILLPVLHEKEDFPDKMIEPLLDTSQNDRNRKLNLYLEIQRRGPNAFNELIKALQETGHWNLVKLLSPEHALNTQFISISEAKKSHKAGLSYTGTSSEIPSASNSTFLYRAPDVKEYINPLNDDDFGCINVIKTTQIGQSPNPEIMCYSMKSKNRGILFMINNISFKSDVEKYREGAMRDQENLEELFKQIGFHQIIIHNNKSKLEMMDLLSEFATSDILERTDCVFIVIASHGIGRRNNETNIFASDGDSVPSNDILEIFNNKNCPLLHNIPKVFIFQVCRGDSPDFGITSEPREATLNERTQLDGKAKNISMRTYSDMLIVHSTVPGFSSHRDTVLGSWYILSLCKIFMRHAHNSHLEDLFRLVDSYLKDIKLQRNSLQTSSVENRGFNKYCFLNPGLFFET